MSSVVCRPLSYLGQRPITETPMQPIAVIVVVPASFVEGSGR